MPTRETQSLCPHCLRRVPARLCDGDGRVELVKHCDEHGETRVTVWRGEPDYWAWSRQGEAAPGPGRGAQVAEDCPTACGLCDGHRRSTCCVLVDVTERCDLGCAVCYASSAPAPGEDPPLEELARRFAALAELAPKSNVQLSGGEPTLRDDLPEVVALGRSFGFPFFQVNSNGLRLAAEPAYAQKLAATGLSTVFLQFDGATDEPNKRLRGASLLTLKLRAIEHCAEAGLGVVLVPTLAPGVNTDQIGALIDLALALLPTVRGVHFQPIAYFGRSSLELDPADEGRITLPEVLRAIEEQTQGRMRTSAFKPSACEHALCSFNGEFRRLPDGRLLSLRREGGMGVGVADPVRKAAMTAQRWTTAGRSPSLCCDTARARPSCCSGAEATGTGAGGEDVWDRMLAELKGSTFSISCMAFQDAWTIDLERLRECALHVLSSDLRLVPFCAYNLTSGGGDPIRGAWKSRHELPASVG